MSFSVLNCGDVLSSRSDGFPTVFCGGFLSLWSQSSKGSVCLCVVLSVVWRGEFDTGMTVLLYRVTEYVLNVLFDSWFLCSIGVQG